ncbi:chloroplast envelope protein translocase family [Micromonas commoda]|uniref:Chloroplast envelope protein translocase family n=1 Tax=Micromonas commoda (strain RCC299 / NOUM17 / CCMP2709) TaxID=296587 RepID=C1ECF7_MICCC|nr:chloroplast envelope protein translocase family [Micromonas commoda]ACO65893.1 chloroplast envelope protein translocase family [Micromonas commoda]|eukprot:XP_002504635.1 chloroplast envelope protein translocase family [Micromonas commoda]
MADSTDDEEYEYDEQASVSEDYPDESEDEQSEDVEEEEDEPEPAPAPAAPTVSASAAPFVPASQAAPAPPAPAPAPTPPAPGANPTAQVSDPTEIRALQALNLMATGVMTRDLALVEGARSAAEFAARVRSIADAQPAPSRPSDEAVRRLTTDLAPLAARLGKFQTRPNDAMAEPADFDRSAEPAAAVPTPAPATSSAAPTLPVPARVAQPPPPVVPEDELSADPGDKEAMTAAKLQSLRVNLLRIATRLGQSPRNTVVAQVIYRLELAEQLKSGKKQPAAPAGRGSTTSFDRAVALAERKEKNDGADSDLGFTCTILLLGKSGTGKSSTINSLLGENTAAADAFRAETKKVRMVEHKMHGMTLRLIDTPGLQPSSSDISYNSKIMADAKRFTRRHKPDIVLYFDRMDQPARVDLADLPLLKTITATFGASVWFNAIVVLTHGSSAPPDGQNGQPISYEMYFAQRSHVVQQIIRQAAGDMRLMNPVALAENHPMCRTNRAGERVLPNGQVWMPQLLLLCFASKILTEANSLLNLQEQNAKAAKAAAQQQKVPPLPFLLSNLITSRKPFKLVGDDDDEYDDASDIILGAPSPYDVPKDQQEEMLPPKQVAVPAPDPQLPPSFDGESVGHRYRFLEPTSQWMVRPIVEAHGWDHESGIEGFSVDKGFVVFNKHPGNMSGQLTKDKKDSNVGFEGGVSVHHTKKLVTTTGVDVQTVGKQLAYTARGETRWKFCAVNKIAAGLSASLVGGALALGTKLENRWKVTPGAKLVVSAGAVSANKDVAYGGNCEAILRHSDDPGNPNSSTVGMSFMNWRGDVALGGNAMSSITLGRDTQLTARANLNSRGAGQLTLRATTNERLQLASLGLVPLLAALIGRIRGD